MITDANLSRREMLAWLGAAGLSTRLGGFAARWPLAYSKWGVQLYTARTLVTRDLPGTLAAIAKIGYKEVETAGYAGRTPADFRKELDTAGLTSPSAHVDINAVSTGFPATLDACKAIGHKWLVVASLPRAYEGADGYKRAADVLSKAAADGKSAGVRIAYHNHASDFAPIGDTTGMDILLKGSSADVAAELDVYWIVKAGGDPFDFIAKHPGRVKMLHLKDASAAPELAMRDVGAGIIDWPKLLPVAEKAGVEHVFVEHDQPGDALASMKASFDYLSHIGKPTGRG